MTEPPRPARFSDQGGFDVRRIGLRRAWGRDLYHFLLTARWPVVIALLGLAGRR